MSNPQEVRRRLLDDFPFYTYNALKIRTKEAKIEPLRLNKAQNILLRALKKQWQETGKIRVVILKARQQGLSTVIGAWLYWWTSQRKAQKTLVMAHKADATNTLFEMTKRYHDGCPTILRPHTKYSSKKELNFDVLHSSYTVATAGGDGVGRSETLTCVHASEVAFWPKTSASEVFNGLTNAVPNMPGTAIFVESTANGVSGKFYDLWEGAVNGTNGYVPVFIPWFESDEYRSPVPPGFLKTYDEQQLAKRFNLDDEQLMFRRLRIGETSKEQFQQEYPSYAEEAFLTTGRPVFDPVIVTEQMEAAKNRPSPKRYALEANGDFEEHSRGELLEFIEYDPYETYYIGADIAEGVRGGDYSVAQVMDSKYRQVAMWRGHIHPDFFAKILYALGKRYNYARIIPERNNHGILTVTRLAKDLAYPNVYLDESVGSITEDYREVIGFSTNAKTKPLIIDQLSARLKRKELQLFDLETLAELRTFIITTTGRMEAEEGKHDDTVMALALANHINTGPFKVSGNEDQYYIEAL